jgi:uncharacterized BrkB/YihY/UPF0761 family membrane protein
VHALAVSASVLLSFFPFLIVMISLCRYGFRWPAAVNAIFIALNDYFPGELGGFLKRNLVAVVESRGPMQITSILLLLVTANGIFLPVEVALNGVWGVKQNRSYFKNQLLSLGLIFLCGGLALLSFILTALNQTYLGNFLGLTATLPLWISQAFSSSPPSPSRSSRCFWSTGCCPTGACHHCASRPWRFWSAWESSC